MELKNIEFELQELNKSIKNIEKILEKMIK